MSVTFSCRPLQSILPVSLKIVTIFLSVTIPQKSVPEEGTMSEKTYWRYFDDASQQYFYYCGDTEETVWEWPADGKVFDPDSLEELAPPAAEPEPAYQPEPEPEPAYQPEPEPVYQPPPEPVYQPPPEPVYQPAPVPIQPAPVQVMPTPAPAVRPQPPGPPAANPIPKIIDEEIARYQTGMDFSEFLEEECDGKKEGPWTPGPLSAPLLKSMVSKDLYGKDAPKLAKDLSKTLSKMFETEKKDTQKMLQQLPSLHQFLAKNAHLVDEAYAETMRAIRGNFQEGNPKAAQFMQNALNLLLFLATLFRPKSDRLVRTIYKQLADVVNGPIGAFKGLAKFAFGRFDAICKARKSAMIFLKTDQAEIGKIPLHPGQGKFYYGVSLYEIFWFQIRLAPKLVVPKPLVDMVNKMFELNAEGTQGIFRLPGDMNKLDTMISDLEHGRPYMEGQSVHDIASLFKRWYRDLPGSILSKEEVSRLMEANSDSAMIALANNLPAMQKYCLMYLIGFLQRMVKAEEVTKMNVHNLGMVFAPNVLYIDPDEDPMKVPHISTAGENFLVCLIENWEVSSVYPDGMLHE